MLSGTALVLEVFIDYTITYWVEDSGSLTGSADITFNAVNECWCGTDKCQ